MNNVTITKKTQLRKSILIKCLKSKKYRNIAIFQYNYLPHPYKAYGDEYCQSDEETVNDQSSSTTYDYQHCLERCTAKLAFKHCGCKDIGLPGIGTYIHNILFIKHLPFV